MGEVYRARDTKLNREAEVLASLNHPNIASGLTWIFPTHAGV